ncbi:MAG: glycosyltransferase [bacterium]|nr:glycosyltransferase [bacterium]
MKNKLAFITPNLDVGGAQTMLVRLVKEISKDKYEICVFVRDSELNNYIEKELRNQGVKIEFLNLLDNEIKGKKVIFKIKNYFKFQKKIETFNPDIIHVHLELFYTLLYGIIKNRKIVMTIHSHPALITTRRLRIMLRILDIKNNLRLVGCAQLISKEAYKNLLKNKNVIQTIYNPIVIDNYKKLEETKNNSLDFIYINVARLHKIKNQKLLIAAFTGVKKKLPNSKLLIVGDGPLMSELKRLTEELGVSNSVFFLGNRNDVANLLRHSDVFVLSSNSEACPMTVLEAMASGLPIISTDVGGVKELIGDNAGILVETGNVEGYTKALEDIQKNSKMRHDMGIVSLQRAKQFSSVLIAKQYELLYESF